MHLFLEGPVQTGKSTLLRECLAPYPKQLGGFSSQRLWQESLPCGYRLTPACEFHLDADYHPDLKGVFMYHFGEVSQKDPSVFQSYGVQLLKDAENSQLILLDEIGGSELLVPAFRNRLYQILSGPTPCIGVLKLSSKASFMSQAAGYPGEVVDCNLQLHEKLNQIPGCRILSFSRENRSYLKREIEKFLEEIF